MFFKSFILAIFFISTFSIIGLAQDEATQPETPAITVDELVICTGIEERQPVGVDTAFVKTVGQLYCFVKLSSESNDTSIFHTWFYNDKEMAKVELSVKGKTWRTWSSKRIVEDWVGNWKVEVTSLTGDVLKTAEFIVK